MRSLSCLVVAALAAVLVSCGDNHPQNPDAGGSGRPECNDNRDNDGDGKTDFPDDPGCDSPADETEDSAAKPQCSDNRDNDGDGKIDYPNDPGCQLAQSDDETDDCPNGPGCPQCGNGRDDDGNGKTDYPADTGCTSAADDYEFVNGPDACGAQMVIKSLPANGMDTGTFDVTMSQSNLITPCGGGGGSPAYAYVLVIGQPKILVATTDFPATTADTVLDLRGVMCSDPSGEIACHDDLTTTNRRSALTASLMPGVYYLIVEGHDTTVTGNYQVQVQLFNGEGVPCLMQSDCGPGLVCRVPAGGTDMICTKPVCSDGLDDDGDGKIDYPNDPGCISTTDATENDTCPAGPGCPECGDGIDNDGDGATDYGMDTSCTSASATSEACVTSEPIGIITTPVTMGTTVGATNDFDPTCNSSTGLAPDVLYSITVPQMVSLTFNVTNTPFFDTVLTLRDSSCLMDIGCRDAQLTTFNNLAAGTYYVTIEGYSTTTSPFTLTTSGVIAANQSCEGPLAQAGAFTCQTGYTCAGPAGMKTCRPPQCADGIDNNGDGKIDFPFDPGCTSALDPTEDTVCPGAMCPVCGNMMDDDADGLVDFPGDFGCIAAGGSTEVFCSIEPNYAGAITMPMTMGTLASPAADNYEQSCQGNTGNDVAYSLSTPVAANWTFDTEGSTITDSVLSIKNANCNGTELACDDDGGSGTLSLINVFLPAGNYAVQVDSYTQTGNNGAYRLNVRGVALAGSACTSPLFASGVMVCPTGQTCTAGVCQ